MLVDLDEVRKTAKVMIEGSPDDHLASLGISMVSIDRGRSVARLSYAPHLIGNPETGVVAGGVMTALLDTACGYAACTTLNYLALTPTIDLRIDYMRPAEPGKAIYAEGEVYRTASNVIFTRGIAYQEDKSKPVAHAVANFAVMGSETFEDFRQYITEAYQQLGLSL